MNVDLRSNYEQVYNQGPDNACGPFAVANALDCIYERTLGEATRFDPYYLWEWVRFHRGLAGTNTGSTFDSLERSLRLNGMKLEGETIKGFELVRTYITDTRYAEVKNLLRMGVPVVWEMKITNDFLALSDKRDWRKHTLSLDTSTTLGQHYVCIVGFDDTCERWLVENSWGPGWADGGFFGVPYAALQRLTESFQHFNQVPINPKKVEGFSMPAQMLTAEKSAFVDRSKQALLQHLMERLTGGVQSLIDACVLWGVSDKHLEVLAGWERGVVRAFRQDNPGLNWDGFIWDQL